jgi:transcriptional repressor NrdR
MEKLKGIDKVAYIRFASVYREFTDLRSFEREFKRLRKAIGFGGKRKERKPGG